MNIHAKETDSAKTVNGAHDAVYSAIADMESNVRRVPRLVKMLLRDICESGTQLDDEEQVEQIIDMLCIIRDHADTVSCEWDKALDAARAAKPARPDVGAPYALGDSVRIRSVEWGQRDRVGRVIEVYPDGRVNVEPVNDPDDPTIYNPHEIEPA